MDTSYGSLAYSAPIHEGTSSVWRANHGQRQWLIRCRFKMTDDVSTVEAALAMILVHIWCETFNAAHHAMRDEVDPGTFR